MTIIPSWVLWAVGVAHILWIFQILILIGVVIFFGKTIVDILKSIQNDTMVHVNHILANGSRMSDDAQVTTHNVTSAANRVSNLVGSAATRLESPVIRAVGLASGLVAGARAASSKGRKTEVVIQKRRRGLFG